MNPTRVIKFQCPECGELHAGEYYAENCCTPVPEEVTVWVCSECGNESDLEECARYCCLPEDVVLPPTPAQLEAAGQQRLVI